MRYRLKDDHSIVCEADFVQASMYSAIILDSGPFRCCPVEDFDRHWEEVPGDDGYESPIVRLDKLKAVAKAAVKLLSPPYMRFGCGLHIHRGVDEEKDWDSLREALRAAGIDWEELC